MNPDESSEAISFDMTSYDIIGELQGRHIYDVTDHIMFYLDWQSLKNVGLVSKRWRLAMLVALGRIVRKGNPNWNAEQLSLWQRFKSCLENDFKIPAHDPRYILCLTNSINLIIGHLQNGRWPTSPAMTLDYLPFLRNDTEDSRIGHLCRMAINDQFIIAWESSTRTEEFQMRTFPSISMDDVKKDFYLDGDYLYYAQSSTSYRMSDNFAKVDLTRIVLSRGIDEEEVFKACVYVEPPSDNAKMYIDCLGIIDDMTLLRFAVYSMDGKRVEEDSVTVQWKLKLGETRNVLKCDTLDALFHGLMFFDKDYLIIHMYFEEEEGVFGFHTYSLHPPKNGASTVECRCIASFGIQEPVAIDYRDGLIAYTTRDREIAFVDVSSGDPLRILSNQIDFLSGHHSAINMARDFVICTMSEEQSATGNNSTVFYVWDLRSIKNQPNLEVELPPVCTFRTFTSSVIKCFEVDAFGIAAVIENDSAKGIQILSCLPACSHCKRLTQPALLKKCSRCKSAAYCSKECQTADWNPHHEAICAKVVPLSFS